MSQALHFPPLYYNRFIRPIEVFESADNFKHFRENKIRPIRNHENKIYTQLIFIIIKQKLGVILLKLRNSVSDQSKQDSLHFVQYSLF